ncbi:DUF484 family protein [Pseudoalteromonas sp. MMG012]|uniref:DUF484 family protein n=1 Tax=Pseudoalteromonas sp. MMG012 TaxID=2822686 RepID=UPI001B3A0047|nr:DUF484 family protein [Pseudoalteromonas sp. MMG012]MBQ4850010.1 DUF484 family protein [Pseudoalteromonas sp. MMG012]
MSKQQFTIDEQKICDYLIRHPDFFTNHQYVLLELELYSQSQGLPNLALQQQRKLREQNTQLKTQLATTARLALENERVFRLFSECQRQLWRCHSFSDLATQLADTLCQNPKVIACELLPYTDPLHTIVETRLTRQNCYLGRLSQQEHNLIWLKDNQLQARSVALYLIGSVQHPEAILAFASDDVTHFNSNNDNLFIKEFIASLELRLSDLA